MENKDQKRALFFSVLSIVLCVAMLIGTTFAWFTDNASTSVNSIEAGTLKVELVNKDGTSLVGKTLDFVKDEDCEEEAILWEPGVTYNLPEVYVKNNGNLALKYKLAVSGIDGDAKLLEAIDWKITVGGEEINLTDFEGNLSAAKQSTDAIVLSGHMKESAGNEYQGLTVRGIAITVIATQYAEEYDSKGNSYDAEAKYTTLVGSQTEFKNVLTQAQAGDTLEITASEMSLTEIIPEGVMITGRGTDMTKLIVDGNDTTLSATGDGYKVTNKNVTISNMTISGQNITTSELNSVINIEADGAEIRNAVITGGNSGINNSSILVENLVSGETFKISNSTISGAYRGIYSQSKGDIYVNNCDINAVYTFNAGNGDFGLYVKGSKLYGWTSYGKMAKGAYFDGTEFGKGTDGYDFLRPYCDTTLTNCTFDGDFQMGAGATGFTITISNCYFNGIKLTASNIASMLDNTEPDVENLKGCTIIIDGVTAQL
ncbi:SipW-dependent-type signal peptide-containing protein [Blautia producta]|uniref:SipW-dependent-type signal peptide-containing protein n=1 Tax=Blautia producta TaxID=33035 RepID=UPI001D03202F|nr:SipW-dependent-type signal peptide-containing protein [Blautia producta]MCB5873866.1 SipW-dependent-type signal peptide-containing protein [Blautia producta]